MVLYRRTYVVVIPLYIINSNIQTKLQVRGSSYDGVVSISDWYSTFCFLANVTHEDDVAKRAGLPPVDGKNQWNAIVQNTPFGPRHNESLHLSANAILRWPWKLVTGRQPYGTFVFKRNLICASLTYIVSFTHNMSLQVRGNHLDIQIVVR